MAILSFVLCFLAAGYFALPKASSPAHPTLEALLVGLGILSTIGLELLALRSTCEALWSFKSELDSSDGSTNPRKDNEIAKKVRDVLTNRDNMTKYLCFSDAPIAFGMFSLTIVLAIHEYLQTGADQEHIGAFLAGAIALQLLYSNVIFWLEAFADCPNGRSRLNRLPTWAMSIRHMLDPRMSTVPTVDWAKTKLAEMFPTPEGCTKPKTVNHQI